MFQLPPFRRKYLNYAFLMASFMGLSTSVEYAYNIIQRMGVH